MNQIEIPSEFAGQKVTCPDCANVFRAPAELVPYSSAEVIDSPSDRSAPHGTLRIVTSSGDSSTARGFGWGCGLTVGIAAGAAVILLAIAACLWGVVGIFHMGANASKTFNSPAKQIGTGSGPADKK